MSHVMKKPKIFLMADYPVGVQVAEFLKKHKENIVGLAVHPPDMTNHINRGCTEKIIKTVGVSRNKIFYGQDIKNGKHTDDIKRLKPDIILTVFWAYILQPDITNIPPLGCVNFHCAFLPYNRGANPNIWSIIDGSPAGVTLHYIDAGVDSGDIIAQKQTFVEPVDTAATVYEKMTEAFLPLFQKYWPAIKTGTAVRHKQDSGKKTYHRRADLKALDVIDLDKQYTGRELINLIRARTFLPFPSAYFVDNNGKRIEVRITLNYLDA